MSLFSLCSCIPDTSSVRFFFFLLFFFLFPPFSFFSFHTSVVIVVSIMLATHFIFSFLLFFVISGTSGKTCSVLDYGGKADNKTDVGPAILKAYRFVININIILLFIPSLFIVLIFFLFFFFLWIYFVVVAD